MSTPTPATLSQFERQEMHQRALRGELTPDDTRRFIEATRASFLAVKTKTASKKTGKEVKASVPVTDAPLDFF